MPGPLVGIGLRALTRLLPAIGRRIGIGGGTRALARRPPIIDARGPGASFGTLARRGGGLLAGGGAFALGGEALSGLFGGGDDGGTTAVRGPIEELKPGMVLPDGTVIGKVWSTDGGVPNMATSWDRKKGIAMRRDGTVKVFRYQKHLVISRNPRVRTINRAAKRVDSLTKSLVKTRTAAKRAGDTVPGRRRS